MTMTLERPTERTERNDRLLIQALASLALSAVLYDDLDMPSPQPRPGMAEAARGMFDRLGQDTAEQRLRTASVGIARDLEQQAHDLWDAMSDVIDSGEWAG